MLVFTVDIDNFDIDEECRMPCGVYDSEEAVMKFITNPEHLKELEDSDPEEIMNIFYIVNVWELNKFHKTPLREYKIFRKDI